MPNVALQSAAFVRPCPDQAIEATNRRRTSAELEATFLPQFSQACRSQWLARLNRALRDLIPSDGVLKAKKRAFLQHAANRLVHHNHFSSALR